MLSSASVANSSRSLSNCSKINFVAKGNRRTPNPEGWEAYDGSSYNSQRRYGWLSDLERNGRDRGARAKIMLSDGTETNPEDLGRLELANMQGTHGENVPLVFRVDIPDGWYRVSCASVNPGGPLPLVDQRSFKCRAHDAVFAGPNYGAPLVVKGNELVEGTGEVEVTDGHLRIVVGDPAYAGWTWKYAGPWHSGWKTWLGKGHLYAATWYQKLTRTVDPGFHNLRLNALQIERIQPLSTRTKAIFRDFFNRDNSPDINAGVAASNRWLRVNPQLGKHPHLNADLYQTSIRLSSGNRGDHAVALLQEKISPARGLVRYSTRVSLCMGQGSQLPSGSQEAGILLLAEHSGPSEYHSTLVGVAIDSVRPDRMGRLIYRVGDGQSGYQTNLEVADTALPFKITEGEYEIVVDHDVKNNVLRQIRINGIDISGNFSLQDRRQRLSRGIFGIYGKIHNGHSNVLLRQFYWYYRVEHL